MWYICVFVSEESISRRWEEMLQQLLEQRELMGNVVEQLHVLRDMELLCQELNNLHVGLDSPLTLITPHLPVAIRHFLSYTSYPGPGRLLRTGKGTG